MRVWSWFVSIILGIITTSTQTVQQSPEWFPYLQPSNPLHTTWRRNTLKDKAAPATPLSKTLQWLPLSSRTNLNCITRLTGLAKFCPCLYLQPHLSLLPDLYLHKAPYPIPQDPWVTTLDLRQPRNGNGISSWRNEGRKRSTPSYSTPILTPQTYTNLFLKLCHVSNINSNIISNSFILK